MKKKNIILTGFMASGKTVVSNRLGDLLEREVFSTDSMIVEIEEKEISDIFNESGEAYFRKAEKEVIREISKKEGIIVDCGGGVVLDKENIDILRKNGIIFLLSASPDLIHARVKGNKKRPLLNEENPLETIKKLMHLRQPLYACANYVIQVDGKTTDEVCEEIITKL